MSFEVVLKLEYVGREMQVASNLNQDGRCSWRQEVRVERQRSGRERRTWQKHAILMNSRHFLPCLSNQLFAMSSLITHYNTQSCPKYLYTLLRPP